ncbi:Hsp70 family protein [Rhodococcus sp. HNM0569]|nr:Hsp70 family protein [Rhodococcus sp. HNM0569]NLU83301.1 Hsp70 family protein [Rhodococcus sp. HNM0569]
MSVRLAQSSDADPGAFTSQVVEHGESVGADSGAGEPHAAALAAEAVGVVLATHGPAAAPTGIAIRNDAQADAVRAAMATQHLEHYTLIPEADAVLAALDASGILGAATTPLVYDLGRTGLSVWVIDRASRTVLASVRTEAVSGDALDAVVRANQLARGRVDPPADAAASARLDATCREAKERLSSTGAVCVPGDGGLVLLSRGEFDALARTMVESSARIARDVVAQSAVRPDLVALVGGGARIPLVRDVLGAWLTLPVVAPSVPETVAAEGAALLSWSAGPALAPPTEPTSFVPSDAVPLGGSRAGRARNRPTPRAITLACGVLGVLGAVGIGLGFGRELGGTSGDTATPVDAPRSQAPVATELPPVTTVPSTTAPEPQYVPPAVQETQEPEPAPSPAPLIPGLPQIQLPTIELPQLQWPPAR